MIRTSIAALLVLWAGTPARAEENHEKLYNAIRANDLGGLKSLLDSGISSNASDNRQITPLMYAAAIGSADAMNLLIARGADVNAQNAAGSTALMWSVTDPKKVRLLLDHDADVNKATRGGRTALIFAGFTNPSAEVARMLLAKGADPAAIDNRKVSTLFAATFGNDTSTVRMLADAGADLNTGDTFVGLTPLMNASGNGNLEAVKLLLAKGAKVNAVSKREDLPKVRVGTVAFGGFTPLLTAAPFSSPDVIRTLLDAGADIKAADVRGFTSLMLAVATDRINPEVVRLLLARGADPKPKTLDSETALDWARKLREPKVVKDLGGELVPLTSVVHSELPDLRGAVQRSVSLLEKTNAEFFSKTGCFACHEQVAADFAVSVARTKGIAIDEKAAADRLQQVIAPLISRGPGLLEGPAALGGADDNLYASASLLRTGFAPNRVTDLLVANLAMQQSGDGRWHLPGYSRSPMQDSDFSRTAMAIRALKAYGPPGRAAEMKDRIERAKTWLMRSEPVILEDLDMRLAGVAAAGGDRATLNRLAEPIFKMQRPDGGWAQREAFGSDAYATGMTLWSLVEAGLLDPRSGVYQKAVKYLLSTQEADGSWHVASRATKFQPYFQSGFPYEHDQWVSTMGTGWAAQALALALDRTPTVAAR